MAEVLVRFDALLKDKEGRLYVPKVCGREMDDGRRWEGWIEFESTDGQDAIRTSQETVQPNHETLLYWASGLTAAYLEGALERAVAPTRVIRINVPERPTFDEPAPPTAYVRARPGVRTVLDPFEVYTQGEDILRRELLALDTMHLRSIARAYDLGDADAVIPSEQQAREELAALILTGVRNRMESRDAD